MIRIYTGDGDHVIYIERTAADREYAPVLYREVLDFDPDTCPELFNAVETHAAIMTLRNAVAELYGEVLPLRGPGYHWQSQQRLLAAHDNLMALPQWSTITAEAAAALVHGAIGGGKTKAEVAADIDARFASASNVASLKTATVATLKTITGEMIDLRTILEETMQALVRLRELAL